MSLQKWKNKLYAICLDITWAHWNRLGATGHGLHNQCSSDPESLLLMTAILGKHDQRLIEIMGQWVRHYESLLSIERIKNDLNELFSDLKNTNLESTNTIKILVDILNTRLSLRQKKRWKTAIDLMIHNAPPKAFLASKNNRLDNRNDDRKKLQTHTLIMRTNLQLTLRALFSPGLRADSLYYALVIENQQRNRFNLTIQASRMARMLHYNHSSIYRTLCELEQGGIIENEPHLQFDKSKIYTLNRNSAVLLKAAEPHEKCFIDWRAIVRIVLDLEHFFSSVEGYENESIIMSRLKRYIDECSSLARLACIPIDNVLETQGPLKEVRLTSLQKVAQSQLEQIRDFITQPEWN